MKSTEQPQLYLGHLIPGGNVNLTTEGVRTVLSLQGHSEFGTEVTVKQPLTMKEVRLLRRMLKRHLTIARGNESE